MKVLNEPVIASGAFNDDDDVLKVVLGHGMSGCAGSRSTRLNRSARQWLAQFENSGRGKSAQHGLDELGEIAAEELKSLGRRLELVDQNGSQDGL